MLERNDPAQSGATVLLGGEHGLNTPRYAAQRLLQAAWAGATTLTWKAASFAGQASIATEPLTDRQLEWLGQLLDRAGLPAVNAGRQ